jgi:hypothetical protein
MTELDEIEAAVLDGNAVAGALAMAMGGEMTDVPAACAHCGTVSVVGTLRAYTRAPGIVLRCPVCSEVVLRIVETPTATMVDTRGVAWWRFDRR